MTQHKDQQKTSNPETSIPLDKRSKYLRELVLRGLEGGERGHIGSSMSLIEILRVLYDDILRHDPKQPDWQHRDRCILSKGHGCLAIYAILADHGYFSTEELDKFCHLDGILGGHPDQKKVPGIEASTGALGHGLSIGVGMALAARIQKRDSRVFVVLGDGEINEGSVWEAAMSAGKHQLDNLVAIVDYNKIQSAGPTSLIQDLEPLTDKWKSFGFNTINVNGHDVAELRRSLSDKERSPNKPTAVIAHTVKGKGISFAEHEPTWHHKSRMAKDVFVELYKALESY